jgi:hypothetical protein
LFLEGLKERKAVYTSSGQVHTRSITDTFSDTAFISQSRISRHVRPLDAAAQPLDARLSADGVIGLFAALALVCDHSATHTTDTIQRWLAAHPRFHLHMVPTSWRLSTGEPWPKPRE